MQVVTGGTVSKNDQIQSIVRHISRAIDNTSSEHLGLELEHFIVKKDNLEYVSYTGDPSAAKPGVIDVLKRLSHYYDEEFYEPSSSGSHLIGLSRELANITLEPGAQIEISIGPVTYISELAREYIKFRQEIDPILDEFGYMLLEFGYHPTAQARNVELLPKDRYKYMDEHFARSGKHGICMMRASASTQVSIDFFSVEDALNKFRLASALTPLLSFITDNCPVFEGQPIGLISGDERVSVSGLEVPRRMVRTVIWDDVDPERSMTMPRCLDEDFDLAAYAETLLDAPAIFAIDNPAIISPKNQADGYLEDVSFAELLSGVELDTDLIEHILSLFFFDARLKTYVEVRGADSLPISYALAYAALIKGIFYNQQAVTSLCEKLKGITVADVNAAKLALREHDFEAMVYGISASTWLDDLIEIANVSLGSDERGYLEPLATLVKTRKTLLDR